jgi:calcineurin-like phosphoesterase family protein
MSQVRFIADLHFGHENMAIKRGFSSAEEHDEHIIEQFNSVVHKNDLTFILGDVTMEKSTHYHLIGRLNGRKVVVLGNHDPRKKVRELLDYVDSVAGCVQYKLGSFLTHVPVHPMEFSYRMRYNIHGHIHEKVVMKKLFGLIPIKDKRYKCVSCEHVDYKPKTLVELGIIDKR